MRSSVVTATVFRRTLGQLRQNNKTHYFCSLRSNGVFIRCLSSHEITEERPSPHLCLRKVKNTETSKHDRPLVILFDWLYAKPTAVRKYCQLYHDRGLDVLTVQGQLKDFMWPASGEKKVQVILDYLLTKRDAEEKILIHAFSVGAYNYTLMMEAANKHQKYEQFRQKVVGQVFDSITVGTYDNMSKGIASNLPKNKLVRGSVMSALTLYYNMTRKHTRDRYDQLVDFFIYKQIRVPSLVFYALNDPMCDAKTMRTMLDLWGKEFPDFPVQAQYWHKSVHAAHLRYHEQEYLQCWTKYMKQLGL